MTDRIQQAIADIEGHLRDQQSLQTLPGWVLLRLESYADALREVKIMRLIHDPKPPLQASIALDAKLAELLGEKGGE